MAKQSDSSPQRPRICVDIDLELRRKLRLAAAVADLSLRDYLLQAVSEKLERDLREKDGLLALSLKADPVLGDLWNNEKDAAYDRL